MDVRGGAGRFRERSPVGVAQTRAAARGAPIDANEGGWRLGFSPKSATSPPLLIAAADLIDSPNLSASGGTTGGVNGLIAATMTAATGEQESDAA